MHRQTQHHKRQRATQILGIIAGLLAIVPTVRAAEPEPARRPNVVFILADDLGWSDLGCYGSTFHKTPHLDALAQRGVRLTQAYAASPLCSPTRASLMTGLYPARIGITNPSCHLKEEIFEETLVPSAPSTIKVLEAVSATRLKQEYYTLAEALKDAGYRTGHFGKWHLGAEPFDPLHQGFDVDFPHWSGPGPAGSYVAPWRFPKSVGLQGKPGEHIEDRVADEVVTFIRANKDRPFFANYWCFSVHSPWNAKKELVERYRASADPRNPQRNPVYAAMVQSLDEGVGRVVATIDELGLADRTIIVFLSDNGGVDWHEPSMKQNAGMDDPPTSNSPLRGGKASLYEGGTREPCMIVWPGVTKPGTTSDAIVQSTDFYPTLLEMCGLRPRAGLALDGTSFVPALRGNGHGRDALFCHFPHLNGNRADDPKTAAYVRVGDWKLIRRFVATEDQSDRYELFNLRDDLSEAHDLAGTMPDKVQELRARLDEFLKDMHAVLPRPNPAYIRGDRWSAGAHAHAEFPNHRAVVASDDDRPTLQLLKIDAGAGPFVVRFRMRARDGRNGLVLWGTDKDRGFAATRRAPFAPKFDGEWHDYAVRIIPDAPLRQLRIDGSLRPTTLEYEWIRLGRDNGTVIQSWDFSQVETSTATR